MTKRVQLSLYVPSPDSAAIEAVRSVVDPVQFGLIPAHVTLCREDELASFESWRERLEMMPPEAIRLTLKFGQAEMFSGHGIMLPCIEGLDRYRKLRRGILGQADIRDSQPHLTLAHPRNPKCVGNTIEAAQDLPATLEITFATIRLIEQVDSHRWRVVETFGPDQAIESHESE